MCVVSMVGDYYSDKWKQPYVNPVVQPYVNPVVPTEPDPMPLLTIEKLVNLNTVDNEYVKTVDFLALKQEVLEMKELLKRAVEYDKRNNEHHCEMEDKVALLKKVAEYVGVSLEDIFSQQTIS